MTSSLNREQKSADRLAFAHYLRTGERLTSEEWTSRVACKFNPYHDPRNGQFTFAPSRNGAAKRGPGPSVRSVRKSRPMSQKDVEAHAGHAMGQYQREIDRGKSPEEAAAWAANSEIESGGDPSKHQEGGGPGRGLFQWGSPRPEWDRRRVFLLEMHIPVDQATYDQQLDFRDWELRHTHQLTQRKMDAVRASRALSLNIILFPGMSLANQRIARGLPKPFIAGREGKDNHKGTSKTGGCDGKYMACSLFSASDIDGRACWW